MKYPSLVIAGFIAVVALFLLFNSAFSVGEADQVIITEFGKPVGGAINNQVDRNEAGLHFKMPFVQKVQRFEKRILEWDGPADSMSTREKLTIVVTSFARWRISDPLKYYQTLRDERSALSRITDIVGSATRGVIAKHDLVEVIRNDTSRKLIPEVTDSQGTLPSAALPPIKFGRAVLEAEVLEVAAEAAKRWGIELLDVQFKRINYNPAVTEKIFDRMTSERMQIAERFRSEGAGEAAKIEGRKERDLRQIESDAYRSVQEIQGKADAEASRIYAEAYSSSPQAAEFYRFIKTLDTYKTALSADSTLVMTTESDFFRYLKSAAPQEMPAAAAAPVPPVVPPVSKPAPAPAPAAEAAAPAAVSGTPATPLPSAQ